jgi:type I restriction enzyme S subunit
LIPSRRKEQEQIAAAIQNLEAQLSKEADGLSKLRQLKSGLMTDLLTGRIRVPETLGATA